MTKKLILPTNLQNINSLLQVGLEQGFITGEPYLFYGTAQQGKSLLLYELAYYVALQYSKQAKETKNIVLIDTEGGADIMIRMWEDVWKKKFGADKYAPKFEIIEAKTAERLLRAFGLNVVKEIKQARAGSSGKTELSIRGPCPNEVLDTCKQIKAGVVIIDSFIAALQPLIVGGLMNYPVRAGAEILILESLQRICDEINPVILVASHASKDPTNQWAKPDFTGGKNLHHGFKFIYYVEQHKHNLANNARRVFIIRYPNVKEWTKQENIWLDDNGFRDISEEELTKLRSTKKKKEDEDKSE